MNSCFTCLNCGKNNPIKGHSYTNKYCNNSCQQQHRSRMLVTEWKNSTDRKVWKQIPEWIKKYLVEQRGYCCQTCGNTQHNGSDIPLVVHHINGDTYNNEESNLELICPNCRSQK